MNDMISRQMAIDEIDKEISGQLHFSHQVTLLHAKRRIERMPSAQPERKKGFWYTLKKGDHGYSAGDFKCSVCGEPNHTRLPKPNFCPNCGADMRC